MDARPRYNHQVNRALEDLNRSMTGLRDSMKGIQIRTAGFKKVHDDFARKVAKLSVHSAEFLPLMLPQ